MGGRGRRRFAEHSRDGSHPHCRLLVLGCPLTLLLFPRLSETAEGRERRVLESCFPHGEKLNLHFFVRRKISIKNLICSLLCGRNLMCTLLCGTNLIRTFHKKLKSQEGGPPRAELYFP